jgi:hypothetical protein
MNISLTSWEFEVVHPLIRAWQVGPGLDLTAGSGCHGCGGAQ